MGFIISIYSNYINNNANLYMLFLMLDEMLYILLQLLIKFLLNKKFEKYKKVRVNFIYLKIFIGV